MTANYPVWSDLACLALRVALTIRVARTLGGRACGAAAARGTR